MGLYVWFFAKEDLRWLEKYWIEADSWASTEVTKETTQDIVPFLRCHYPGTSVNHLVHLFLALYSVLLLHFRI